MKNKLYTLCFLGIFLTTSLKAQLRTPALSPEATIIQMIGLTEVKVTYSRPHIRNRIIFGDDGIVPYSEFWRTGANAATKITFSDPVVIANTPLKKGTYTILTKPEENAWTLYFYPYESRNWNSYITNTPVATIPTESFTTPKKTESFTIAINDVTLDSAKLSILWENTGISIPIITQNKDSILKNIKTVMSGPSNGEYFRAALYLHQTQQDLNSALTYIQKVTKGSNPRFFQVYREALILKDLNREKEALAAAQKSLQLSEKSKNKDFVRLNQKLIEALSQ
ncbi:DUF2911 domain-containing protein [Aquimarina sp. 2201CG1-2-11]|uniref:DUF2911 domain-containing protein n=1 Tax=Aquimarina discodermiae TaxID=3231043 RepID=UPI0034625B57